MGLERIAVSGGSLAVRVEGAGPPAVFLHGYPLDHSQWDAQVEAFRGTRRCLAPDLRGFGASTLPAGPMSMDDHADDLAALLDGLGATEPVALAGLSMGGYIAFAFWRRHRARVRSLALCCTRAAPDSPAMAEARRAAAARVHAEGAGPTAAAMREKLFAAGTRERQPELVARLHAVMAATAPAGLAAALLGMAERPDRTPELAGIDVPTLVLAGAEDAVIGITEASGLARAIPGAKFVEIAAAGHLAPAEQPAAANAALRDFL